MTRTGQSATASPTAADQRPVSILLTPVQPLPGGSGIALRAWTWLQALSRTTRVVVLCIQKPGVEPLPPDYPAIKVVWIGSDIRTPGRAFGIVGGLLPFLACFSRAAVVGWPMPVPTLISKVEAELGPIEVSQIVVFRLLLHDVGMALAHRFPAAEVRIDLDDLESETRASIAFAMFRTGRFRSGAKMLVSALQYYLIERSVSGPYKVAYLAAEQDIARLRHRIAPETAVWRNRVPLPAIAPIQPDTQDVRLLFVGTLGYVPNEEAVRFLARQLAPKLRRALSRRWRIVVVGREPRETLVTLAARVPEMELVADADDLAAYYAGATAVLVPLWAGGGTKLKTIEAFAYRRPVVATPHGVRGLNAKADEHYLEANTADEFVAAIRSLIDDPALACRLVAAAAKLPAASPVDADIGGVTAS